jgi:hypothetical protein
LNSFQLHIVKFYWKKTQVISLKAVCNIHTAEHTIPEFKYFGQLADGRTDTLEEEWVKENFDENLILQVQQSALDSQKRFIRIPPGAALKKPEVHDFDFLPLKIKYQQHNTSCCLFLSVASALHLIGFEETAAEIANIAPKYEASSAFGIFNWEKLLQIMQTKFKFLQPKKLSPKVDLLKDKSPYLSVVVLMSSDGGIQHAVTVIGDIVCDSNCEYAMPLCKEALDFCCSTENQKLQYVRIYHGFRFEEQNHDTKNRWMKRVQKHLP